MSEWKISHDFVDSSSLFFPPSQEYYLIHVSLIGQKEKLLEDLNSPTFRVFQFLCA